MKKRLEAELISIAHRILKLKNRSEVDQLHKETQKLLETLTVLKFYQDHFEIVKSEVSQEEFEEKLALDHENETHAEETLSVAEEIELASDAMETPKKEEKELEEIDESPIDSEELNDTNKEAVEEELNDSGDSVEPAFEPLFDLEDESVEIDSIPNSTDKIEDIIGNYSQPEFVKTENETLFPDEVDAAENTSSAAIPNELEKNDSKSVSIGLNDRIGFVKHLFNDSNEDFNRVMSQLNTFGTFEEAKNFINEMVIPDYDYWVGQEEYFERFMVVIEKKFL